MIVGISGRKQSGKDTIATMIQVIEGEQYKTLPGQLRATVQEVVRLGLPTPYTTFTVKKFADKLKDMTCLLLGCTREQLEDINFKEAPLKGAWNPEVIRTNVNGDEYFMACDASAFEPLTPRKVLQLLGTDCVRTIIHPDAWVISTLTDYKKDDKWIISDTRFPNEANAIKKLGGVLIRVERGDSQDAKDLHISETALDNYEHFDYTIFNDGSLEELETKIRKICLELDLTSMESAQNSQVTS